MILPLLFLVFLAVPIIEIYLIIQVGHAVGALNTVLILIADSILGSWLVKREGFKAWTRLREAIAAGRMPTKELADGVLVVIGGALLITPGFMSDILGLICVLPFTRPAIRGVFMRRAAARAARGAGGVRIVDMRDHQDPSDEQPPLQ